MSYKLYIGNKRYSSWSMRPWVLMKALGVPFEEKLNFFKPGQRQSDFLAFSPTCKVPCLVDDLTHVCTVWDSFAIIEYLADGVPEVWPDDGPEKVFARCAAAEMHSGFNTIRNECSMNVALRIDMGGTLSEGLQRDIARLNALFMQGLDEFGGPWLAGEEFTAVDAFFAPIASRVKTYGLEMEEPAAEYMKRLYEHHAVQAWIQEGIKETAREPDHEEDCVRGRTILDDLSTQ